MDSVDHSSSSSALVCVSSSLDSGFPYDPCDKRTWEHLVFPSEDAAFSFYSDYANLVGFGARIGHQIKRDSKNKPVNYNHYLKFECYKEGFKLKSRIDPSNKTSNTKDVSPILVSVRKRGDSRIGCPCFMTLKMDFNKGGYTILQWDGSHNHELEPGEHTHLFNMNRSVAPIQGNYIDLNLRSGISLKSTYDSMSCAAGGRDKLGFTKIDLKNYLRAKRQREMLVGEATNVQRWLKDQAMRKPGFYYDIQVDEDEQISSIFWTDGLMRLDYGCFGDFVSFDTTYRTNKEYRPLAVFVGLNHHRGTCVFGAALLYDETIPTFEWLFQTFLKCMDAKHPQTFMTDQCPAMKTAVRNVFPGCFHAVCTWHIEENAKRKLGAKANEAFFHEFGFLVNVVDNEAEFDFSWDVMIEKCFGGDNSHNTWLKFIHDCRHQWSGAWRKSHFTGGKSTTQLSEQFNAFLRRYLQPDHSVSTLLEKFVSLVDDLRYNELMRNHAALHIVAENNFRNSALMKHAAKVYTPKVFALLQEQFAFGQGYIVNPVIELSSGTTNAYVVYKLKNDDCGVADDSTSDEETVGEKCLDEETVKIDTVHKKLTCSCRMFENWGFFCRHILKTMDALAAFGNPYVRVIPDNYVLRRYTKDVKAGVPLVSNTNLEAARSCNIGQRYQQLCAIMVDVGCRISSHDQAYELFLNKVVAAAKEAEGLLGSVPQVLPDRNQFTSNNNESPAAKSFKKRVNYSLEKKRIKSSLELSYQKKRASHKKKMKSTSTPQLRAPHVEIS